MKACPPSQHHFVHYEPSGMWSTTFIYCQKCGLRGPFQFPDSTPSGSTRRKE